jgi:acyl CoA:acetate/3-ketoacid CoA transferase alpha subunit/acyl CoA:acetate/3-ketoacid CoA transferase beta subunit
MVPLAPSLSDVLQMVTGEPNRSDGGRRAAPMVLRTSKVMSPEEAVTRFVEPGMTLSLAFGDARPNAILREVVRQFRGTSPGFTVVTSGLLNTQQALVGAGLVRRLVTSFAGENYPAPWPSPVVRRALEDGSLTIEDWSLYTLVARLAAGALGVPFFPVRSFADGSMSGREDVGARAEVVDPFEGGTVTVVPRLTPDVCFVHGVAADEDGNVVLAGPVGEREWGALASRRGAVVSVERIVDASVLRRHNAVVRIPSAAVVAVCEAPRGSHPYGLYTGGFPGVSGYDEDAPYMKAVRGAMLTPEDFEAWTTQWLEGPWPVESVSSIGAPTPVDLPAGGYTDNELMVVAAARQLVRRTRDGGARMLLAGIGQANLAAWLAHDVLEAQPGPPVELLAEMGMVGYKPQPGDSYIFANRNKPGAAQLTDTMAVLGSYVGHPRMPTLAAVGAGQVDAAGNINSSVGADGRYLTGSGGVNDIASVAAELLVVLKQARGRLVDEVSVRTAPGRQVRTVVTDRAVFVRDAAGFRLEKVLEPAGAAAVSTADLVAAVRDRCGWSGLDWPADVPREPPPTDEELETIRSYDPHRHFLR